MILTAGLTLLNRRLPTGAKASSREYRMASCRARVSGVVEMAEADAAAKTRKSAARRDLTRGSITKHLLGMAAFIGVGLIVQTLYFLVDLYFVAHLGKEAIAGVSTAGTVWFVAMAATQLIAVGALSLISQAVGRKDDEDGQLVFDQTVLLSLFAAVITLALGYVVGEAAMRQLGADAASARAGWAYLATFLPSLALMFPMAAISAALRASGVVGAPMAIQSGSVLVNVLLAPVLIAGWGTGHPLGVAGAGLASSIAVAAGLVALVALFPRMQQHITLGVRHLRPRLDVWKRIAFIGAPAAGEFFLMFVIYGVIYWVIRGFGAEAQAGFGIGGRVMQSIFLPAMAVAFAAAPIAGQNFGARNPERVVATFRQAALIGSAIMLALTLLCHLKPEVLAWPFTQDPAVIAVAATYLKIASWNFVAIGLVFACSGMFQALGDTRPALISSASRLVTFAAPALWLSTQPGVRLEHFWYLSVASITLQALVSLWLVRRELRRKLGPMRAAGAVPPAEA
jgi:MATE family, multidrug efflux pump